MDTASNIILTTHAIDRFRTRHAPHMTHSEAARELTAYLPDAVKIDEKSILGQDQWLIAEPYGVLLVCKNDPKVGIVAVTSLHFRMRGPSADDVAEFRAAAARNVPAVIAAAPKVERVRYVKPVAVVDEAEIARRREKEIENERRQVELSAAASKARAARKVDKATLQGMREHHNRFVHVTVENEKAAREKFRAYCDASEKNADTLKRVLRMMMRAVEPFVGLDSGITEAWDTIAAEQPGLVSDKFLGTLAAPAE